MTTRLDGIRYVEVFPDFIDETQYLPSTAMFVREKKTRNKKTGNIYVKHVLVESYHTTKGPQQRTVMQLGRIDLPRKKWSVLAKALENRLAAVPMQEQLSFVPENKTKQTLELENRVRIPVVTPWRQPKLENDSYRFGNPSSQYDCVYR